LDDIVDLVRRRISFLERKARFYHLNADVVFFVDHDADVLISAYDNAAQRIFPQFGADDMLFDERLAFIIRKIVHPQISETVRIFIRQTFHNQMIDIQRVLHRKFCRETKVLNVAREPDARGNNDVVVVFFIAHLRLRPVRSRDV
jgi:hypothetical protein